MNENVNLATENVAENVEATTEQTQAKSTQRKISTRNWMKC